MIKKLLTLLAGLAVVSAFAAVEVNKATEAELDSIKGIGPAKSKLIISERQKSEFKSWDDFSARVKGVGDKTAAKYSAEGLTVNGAAFKTGAATPASKATGKDAAKSASAKPSFTPEKK